MSPKRQHRQLRHLHLHRHSLHQHAKLIVRRQPNAIPEVDEDAGGVETVAPITAATTIVTTRTAKAIATPTIVVITTGIPMTAANLTNDMTSHISRKVSLVTPIELVQPGVRATNAAVMAIMHASAALLSTS